MIAVVGATGFTGHRIARRLADEPLDDELVAVVRESSDRCRLGGLPLTVRTADVGDRRALVQALRGARLVVHTPSLGFGHAPAVVDALEAVAPERVVIFSTTSIFTRLPSRSVETRLVAEDLVTASGLPAVIVRPTMIYGRPGDRNIERLLSFLRRSPVMPIIGRGEGLQQPVHVDDLADAVVRILASTRPLRPAYDLPGPVPLTFRQLVSESARAVGRRARVVTAPRPLALAMAAAWARSGLPPRVRPEQLLRLEEDKTFDPGPAIEDFGYEPREFAAGVAEEASLLGKGSTCPSS